MIRRQDKKTEKEKKDSKATNPADSKSKSVKDWTDNKISLLTDLLQSNPSL